MPTQEDFERYCNGHKNRMYAVPIIKDNSDQIIYFGDPDNPVASLGPPPDRCVGYRFYVENDGVKRIIETRADETSDYNLFKVFYRDWPESDALKTEIDSRDRLEA